jgi:hypothetical protein
LTNDSSRRTLQNHIKISITLIPKQMQMEIYDTLTIQPHTPLAFVLANGDTSKATNSPLAHLQKRIYVDNSKADDKP